MDVKIDYDDKTARFVLHSPPWMVNKMRAIPNRRWDSKRKVWTAPALKANIKHLLSSFSKDSFTPSAMKRAEEAMSPVAPVRQSFPHDYAFKVKPMLHQMSGLDKIYSLKNWALFMEARTGKTKVVIDNACALNAADEVEAVVIVCPNTLKKNWQREVSSNTTRDFMLHLLDTSDKKGFDKWVCHPHRFKWLVVAVETLSAGSGASMVERFMLTSTKVLMVIDESHKIKSHNKIRSKTCVDLGKLASRRGIMSGTPMSNGYMDLFMQFEFLDPDIIGIGDFYSFRNRYAVMGGYDNKEIVGYQDTDELTELIAPVVYRVKRREVFHELPPKEYELRTVKMGKEQKALYDALKRSKKLDGGGKRLEVANAMNLMARLQEITSGVITYENPNFDGVADKVKYVQERAPFPNPKLDALLEIAEDEDGSMIIWALYREEIAAIADALREKYGAGAVVEVHGGIDVDERDHNVYELFQKKKARFLVGNPATASVGLEMSAAETMVYMSNSFNYVDRSQSEDRASSSLQKSVVKVIDVVTESSVDEVVKEALDRKQDLADYAQERLKEVIEKL